MSTTDDIKAKIDLVDYLREQGLVLKQAGQSFKACCPFHNEKSPSFMVNRQKQVWFCFGCSKGGDLFSYVQEREGLEFGETLRLLAERAGVQLEARDPRLEGAKTRALTVLEAATTFFQRTLQQSTVAQQYVARRGISDAMLTQFQIGYAPDRWDTLSTHLMQQGFRTQEIVDAGMALPSRKQTSDVEDANGGMQAGSRIYDRFRHRLMFPIHDVHGRVIGFTGRILDGGTTSGDAPAKYVNTPESPVYKKQAVVYGLVFAKEAIRTAGYALLVEGQMDVVTSHAAGLAQTVATSGTAFTEQQLRLLKRFTERLHLAFDADSAGQDAAMRSIDAALDAGFDVRVVQAPRHADGTPIGKDADECLRADADAWRAAVANAPAVLDHTIARVRTTFDCTTPTGKRDAGHMLLDRLQHVADPIERAAWIARSADAIGVPESALREVVNAAVRRARQQPRAAGAAGPTDRGRQLQGGTSAAPVADPAERFGNRLLALMLRHREQTQVVFDRFPVDNLPSNRQQELYKTLQISYAKQESLHSANFADAEQRGYVERLELFADREFSDLRDASIVREIDQCVRELRRFAITRQLHGIAQRLKGLEHERAPDGARDEVLELEHAFLQLTNELSSLHSG
ncbi:MAG: DNA primase [bacterium]|nr:DNA primase [bacterium]